MIRFLQTDNRLVKALLVVIIGAASVSMVVYLIPGLMGMGASSSDTFAVVYPHWYSRFFASGATVSQTQVEKVARQQLMQRNPQYADNPMILNFFEQQVGQQLVQQEIMVQEAKRLGIDVTDSDVRNYLRSGPTGAVLFPNGQFIGSDAYASLIANRLDMSVGEFEAGIKRDIAIRRLQALITGGVTVSNQEVREAYRKANIKIKFDYAVLSADSLRNQISPSDAELQAFFKKNAARYANAVPEERQITYFAFTTTDLPGGVPQPTQQEIQQYYNDHQSDYSIPEEAKSRHILIKVADGADAKTDAAAKAKAESLLKQLQNGADFAKLAKQYSDDPGSKDSGGELGFVRRGTMVPPFDHAIFTQKIGEYTIVKSQYGYHIVQVEARQAAHVQPLSEVQSTIQATLLREKESQAEETFARQLTSEAIKNGLQKTAAAHHLQLATTPYVTQQGIIGALPDSSQILTKAFASKQGDPPQDAPTGEGYAVFQVTGVQAAHAPTFADWKSHVLDDYRNDQLPALLNQKTRELANEAKDMNDLAKAAKQLGATMKTSDEITPAGQVPDLGAVGQVAPQLFNLAVGAISGPINTPNAGVVAKIIDKQEPTAEEIAKNFDQTRDQLLEERRNDAFSIFASNVLAEYRKHNLVQFNTKAQNPQIPGM